MILDATTRKVQILLRAPVAANQCPVYVDYVDFTSTATTPGNQLSNTNSTTAVDIVNAPAASTQRKVNLITVCNRDTDFVVVTIRLNDNATLYNYVNDLALPPNSTLQYTDTNGWSVITTSGAVTAASIGSAVDIQTYTANGTWTKPTNATFVQVDVCGGGGAGGSGASRGGGGGGAHQQFIFLAANIPTATVAITVAAATGTSSFGTYLYGYGGGNGASTLGGGGGGGTGSASGATGGAAVVSGATNVATPNAIGAGAPTTTVGLGSYMGGGSGGGSTNGNGGGSFFSAGGGGGGTTGVGGLAGGSAVSAGSGTNAVGVGFIKMGDGGNAGNPTGTAGAIPGGGGGAGSTTGGAGARGQVWVTSW